MEEQKEYTVKVSDSFDRLDEKHEYEVSFRRWLVREIEEGRLTTMEAVRTFNLHPDRGRVMIWEWRKKYAPSMLLSLPEMTEQEQQDFAALQKQLKAMEKQLEEARMRNIALNTLIDVAEETLKIDIRKKPGAKQ